MVSKIERIADGRRSAATFSRGCKPLEPDKREAVRECAARLRDTMRRILSEKGIRIDTPSVEVSRSIHALVTFLDIAAEELRPKHMRRYGSLTEEAAAELDAVATEIQQLLKQMASISRKDWDS